MSCRNWWSLPLGSYSDVVTVVVFDLTPDVFFTQSTGPSYPSPVWCGSDCIVQSTRLDTETDFHIHVDLGAQKPDLNVYEYRKGLVSIVCHVSCRLLCPRPTTSSRLSGAQNLDWWEFSPVVSPLTTERWNLGTVRLMYKLTNEGTKLSLSILLTSIRHKVTIR